MMDQERIEIKVSKKKAVFALLGSVAFVVVCAWLIGTADDQTRYNPAVMRTVAYIGIAFFGIAGLYVFYKLFDSKPGLIIDSEGIFDNSSAIGGYLIKWDRITGIQIEQVMSTKFLLIYITDPESVVSGMTGIRKQLVAGTYSTYGTPVAISNTSLSCDFDELHQMITERWKRATNPLPGEN